MKRDTGLAVFILRLSMALLFLVPGIYKVFMPQDFIGFLEAFPAFLAPFLPLMFWGSTIFELVAGVCLLIGYKVRWVALPLAVILLVALVTVAIPDAAVSKIGLINILFHITGMGVLVSFLFLPNGKWSVER